MKDDKFSLIETESRLTAMHEEVRRDLIRLNNLMLVLEKCLAVIHDGDPQLYLTTDDLLKNVGRNECVDEKPKELKEPKVRPTTRPTQHRKRRGRNRVLTLDNYHAIMSDMISDIPYSVSDIARRTGVPHSTVRVILSLKGMKWSDFIDKEAHFNLVAFANRMRGKNFMTGDTADARKAILEAIERQNSMKVPSPKDRHGARRLLNRIVADAKIKKAHA